MVTVKDVYEIGEAPPIGKGPRELYDQGERRADLKPNEALVMVMAAGINFNNVWAALGVPLDVIKVHEREGDTSGYHIGGSDASGIVYAAGSGGRNVKG